MNHILIIEDDEQTRANLELILEMENFEVCSAPNGAAGLEQVRRRRPDLVLCDVSMPRLDGHGVLSRLRADPRTTDIPFVFLTARGERADLREGMNLGADDYLCKPVDAEDLLATIRTRLKRRHETQEALLNEVEDGKFASSTPLEALGLTAREAQVLLWVAQGKANGDVAAILGMSEKTVKIHLGHVFEKLDVETRTAAACLAVETLTRSKLAGRG